MSRRSGMLGFTLIELMIVVAVLAIFASIAVPSFTQFINNNRTQAANNELLALLQFARSLAVETRASISVCQASDGWSVKEKDCSAGSKSLRSMEMASGITLGSDQDQITFRYNGSATQATVYLCNGNDFANGFTVKVAAAGSVRTYGRGKSGTETNAVMNTCTHAQPDTGEDDDQSA